MLKSVVNSALGYFKKVWENLKRVYRDTSLCSAASNHVTSQVLSAWPDRPDMADVPADLSFLITPEQLYHKMVKDWSQANGE